MSTNRLSLDITDAQKLEVKKASDDLKIATQGFNVVIDTEEIKSLPKIADGRIPFVEKTVEYSASNPEFLAPHANIIEAKRDLKTYLDLREMARPLRQLLDNLENSMMVVGSDAYEAARDYYKTVKFHAEMGTPGAQTIYEDLRQLFEMRPAPDPEG